MPALIDPFKFAAAGVSWASAVAARSPLAWYRLGDAALTTTPADSSGNGLTGSSAGGPTFAVAGLIAGDADTAVSLDDASSESILANVSGTLHAKDFAFAIWLKSVQAGKVIFRDATSLGNGYVLDNNSPHTMRISGTSFNTGVTSVLGDGSKHFVVWRVANTVADLWVDGVKVYTTAITASASRTAPTAAWRLGRNGTGTGSANHMDAICDEWAIFSSLSDADVAALYAAGN